MITDDELMKKIDEVSEKFVGPIDDLYIAVGLIVVGRRFGWRVIRLCSSRKQWARSSKIFGDLKEYMPERGFLARKSVGLKLVDKAYDYWAVVKGSVSLPMKKRKELN
jgi:uncharacterized membrane protein YecN with MAPEG domain